MLAPYNGCGYTVSMVLELKLRKVGNSVDVVLQDLEVKALLLRDAPVLQILKIPVSPLGILRRSIDRLQRVPIDVEQFRAA